MEIRRMPAVAGLFYPLYRDDLVNTLRNLFTSVKGAEPNCTAIISPHAGYQYSGLTAAYSISSLKPLNRFIILGPNHYLWGEDFALMGSGSWETPLGGCKLDHKLALELKKAGLPENTLAHEREHSIEVQLPLLQYKHKGFSFVPVSIMCTDYSAEFLRRCENVGKIIAGLMKDGTTGLIASSDFSHQLPLQVAQEKDEKALEAIKSLDPRGLFKTLKENQGSVCGYGPMAILLEVARELGLEPRIIHSSSSANSTGDKRSVVTYHSVGFA